MICNLLVGFSISPASAIAPSQISVLSSENISSVVSGSILKVYLNVFHPMEKISFTVNFASSDTTTVITDPVKMDVPPNSGFHFSLVSGALLSESVLAKPIKEITDSNGKMLVQVYPAPADFPLISFSGDTTLISKSDILSTPVVANGTYAIDSNGKNIKFFIKSPSNLIGFRKITDAPLTPGFGGVPEYAYLEQQDFGVTATSPGVWRMLDSNFRNVQRINDVKTKYGTSLPEGHAITVSKAGNPVVISTITRNVDSTWLKRGYKLPILDCIISEVHSGIAIKQFSFWDWAVANKSVSEPLIDKMRLFNDPQSASSPIDVCHANSMQFHKATNDYLISLRSPSILIILDSNLQKVKKVIETDNSLQHFARYDSNTEITALGNFTFDRVSQFLDFKLSNGKWQLKEIPFPVHIPFCGNTQYLDSTHIWLGGGCGPFSPGVLGAIFKVTNSTMVQVGTMNMKDFNYSYRADIVAK
jgi:hypothetical protein